MVQDGGVMIDESLRQFLLQHPGIVAEVGNRVYPQPLPQGATLPALTYADISDVGSMSNDGPDCHTQLRYQIDHWATTREVARRVERATRQVMNGYRGQWPGGRRIGGVFRVNTWTLHEPDERIYRTITDYRISDLGE